MMTGKTRGLCDQVSVPEGEPQALEPLVQPDRPLVNPVSRHGRPNLLSTQEARRLSTSFILLVDP